MATIRHETEPQIMFLKLIKDDDGSHMFQPVAFRRDTLKNASLQYVIPKNGGVNFDFGN